MKLVKRRHPSDDGILPAEYAIFKDPLFPIPEIDAIAVAQLAQDLSIFYTYAIYTPRNSSVYIGLSRQSPDRRMDQMARRVRWGAEFSGFWGWYGIAIISSGLSQAEVIRDERKLIRNIRSGTKYRVINKSNGGEPGGYPLEKAIRDAVLEKYVRYLTEDVETQRFWSLERWKTNPRPECSVR